MDKGIQAVLAHGQYILGPEVSEFEDALSDFCDADHTVSCANGTDALILPMMAWKIGRGDAVFCPSFTYCATAEAIALKGATPIFVDIDRDTYNMDANSLQAAIDQVVRDGKLRPRAVIIVDLFGQPADYPALLPIAQKAGLKVISDCAQALGCTLHGKGPLEWADVMTTSFFPAKPLGCYGDGGALLTNDVDVAKAALSLRFHGRNTDIPGDHKQVGLNSRLDTLQAAILLVKLSAFADELSLRNKAADYYSDRLRDHVGCVPTVIDGGISSWAQYTIEVDDPSAVQAALKNRGIPSARYYPLPVHRQSAYADLPTAGNGLPNTDAASHRTLSLPIYPDLTTEQQDEVVEGVLAGLQG